MIFPLFRPILFRRVRVLSVTLDRVDLASTFPENPLISSFSFFFRERPSGPNVHRADANNWDKHWPPGSVNRQHCVYHLSCRQRLSKQSVGPSVCLYTHTCHRGYGLNSVNRALAPDDR